MGCFQSTPTPVPGAATAKAIDDKKEQEVRNEIINTLIKTDKGGKTVNVCPFAVRLVWHSAGTFDASDNSGGSNGATMRFAPEMRDGPNVGLDQMQAILQSIKDKHPGVSCADIWTLAGRVSNYDTNPNPNSNPNPNPNPNPHQP